MGKFYLRSDGMLGIIGIMNNKCTCASNILVGTEYTLAAGTCLQWSNSTAPNSCTIMPAEKSVCFWMKTGNQNTQKNSINKGISFKLHVTSSLVSTLQNSSLMSSARTLDCQWTLFYLNLLCSHPLLGVTHRDTCWRAPMRNVKLQMMTTAKIHVRGWGHILRGIINTGTAVSSKRQLLKSAFTINKAQEEVITLILLWIHGHTEPFSSAHYFCAFKIVHIRHQESMKPTFYTKKAQCFRPC